MLLIEYKEDVEHGRTAKHAIPRTILHVLIKKEPDFYVKQYEGYTNKDGNVIVPVNSHFYPSWGHLIASLTYFEQETGWVITDEPIADYLPPERKTAP
jgi:hypothetical protein